MLEDDPLLSRALSRRLRQHDLVGDEVATLASARAALAERRYDCLVLDRMVPDGDAIELVEEVHRQPDRPPVLILSGLADTEERIRGLEVGADEYLAKPALLDEVLMRVTKLMAYGGAAQGERVRLGSVALDRARHRVTADGVEVRLAPRQYAVFQYLVAKRHCPVSAEELLEHCWDGKRPIFANPVHSQITRLRRIFRGRLSIESVRGMGYLIEVVDPPVVDGTEVRREPVVAGCSGAGR